MTKEDVDEIIVNFNNDGINGIGDLIDETSALYLELISVENEYQNTSNKARENKLLDKYHNIVFQILKNIIPEEYADYFYTEMAKLGKNRIIKYIESDEDKIRYLNMFPDDKSRLEVIKKMEDDNILDFLQQFGEKEKLLLIGAIKDSEKREKAFDELEGKYKHVLKRMFKTNDEVLENIDIRILDEKYLQTLGEDKINLISCYPYVQKIILDLSEKEYNIFVKCLDNYIMQRPQNDEWTTMAEVLLENLSRGQYTELINNIDDIEQVDISKLSKILQLTNDFGIKTIEDVKNYEEIKNKKCDEIINSEGDIRQKKKAVLLKLFGQDYSYTQDILEKYGEDINSIDDGDEKDFVIALKEIMALEDEETLRQIYNECESIGLIDKTLVERELRTAFGKKFNEGLYEVKDEDSIETKDLPEELKGLNLDVYDAGTDFKMIITSVAPYVKDEPDNYKADWNRPKISSQHFCASYIRNDMLKRADMPHICYGFTKMKDDSLMLAGEHDTGSDTNSFAPEAKRERYFSPDRLINETIMFNEIDFRRIQGGVKKQPSYIVAFRKKGKIDNIEKIIQAAKDWEGKLPIVIIDEDKVREAEKGKIQQGLDEYKLSKDPQKAREILQRLKNNDNTYSFRFDKDTERYLNFLGDEMKKQEQEDRTNQTPSIANKVQKAKAELSQIYDGVSAKERQESVSEIRRLREKIQNITQKKEGGAVGR